MSLKLSSIKPSTRQDKKYMATFSDGAVTHFGAKGYADYTTHKDESRKRLYISRHSKNENWNDPKSPGALARYILWNKPSLQASTADYRKRFNV